jgi:hypothetical protein
MMIVARRIAVSLGSLAPMLAAVSLLAGGLTQGKPRVNADAALSVEFLKGVQAYVELHRKLEATLPPRPEHATPAEIETHEQAIARLIIKARAGAKQGDLLPQKIRAYLRRQIGGVLRGPDGAVLRQSVMEENPGKVRLRCNARYPEGLPITTMPPPILAALPKLPDHVEYRFVGDRLVLLDVHAQLVMDYMTDALPR